MSYRPHQPQKFSNKQPGGTTSVKGGKHTRYVCRKVVEYYQYKNCGGKCSKCGAC